MADPISSNGRSATDPDRIPIVRDSAFVRFTADKAAFTTLGRDLEVAFLQMGPLYTTQVNEEDGESFDGERVLTEVARLRIGVPEFLTIAMNFLQVGITGGFLKGEAVRTTLDQWIAQADSEQGADGE